MKLINWQQHEPILLAFEEAWNSGVAPDLATFLHQSPIEHRTALLVELVLIDFEHRCRRSQMTDLDTYLNRYPELRNDQETLDELIAHEYRLRSRKGTAATQGEIDSRFAADSTAREIWQRASDSKGESRCGPLQLSPGTIMHAYVIESILGNGTFATVYSAIDTRLNRRVAIKLLSEASGLRREMRQRMQREAQAVASLSHPNIVPVFDSGTFDSHDYIVTRLIEGETLAHCLRGCEMSVRTSVELVCKLASALGEVHRLGVVHRDINLTNIMLEKGVPQLLDFGLAAHADASEQLTQAGDVVGTPAFMPPEQADGRAGHADARSDVYSLGAVLYRLVCGRLPFEGTTAEVISKVIHCEPRISARTVQQIGKDLETIILKCLQKEPSHRYQTAPDLEADLRSYLAGSAIKARPIGYSGRILKWAQRRPALASATLGILLALGFVIGAATQLGRIASQRDDAKAAQRETQDLLAQSAADAGMLAMQRGQLKQAIEHFQLSLERGNSDRIGLQLKLVEAYLINDDVGQAMKVWLQASQSSEASNHQVQLGLWRAELAIAGLAELGDGVVLMQQVQSLELPPYERFYVDGMLAESSLQAVSLFQRCTSIAPFHYRSRRLLILTLMSLGDLEAATNELRLARQLFPENTDFILLSGLCQTAQLRLEDGLKTIRESGLNEDDVDQWTEACRVVYGIVDQPDIDSGMGELDFVRVAAVLDTISSELNPLFSRMRWRLPLRIESQLSTLLTDFQDLQESAPSNCISAIEHFVKIHPEGSLLVVLAGLKLSLCNADASQAEIEIPHLEQARSIYQQALLRPGYLKHNEQMIWKAIFTTSTILSVSMDHDVETNQSLLLEAARKIRGDSITTPGRARTFVILSMQLGDFQLANRWADRWIELTTSGEKDWQDAVWHRAVLSQRLEHWIDVVHWCDTLLDVNPDYPEVVPLRDGAKHRLKELLEDDHRDPS